MWHTLQQYLAIVLVNLSRGMLGTTDIWTISVFQWTFISSVLWSKIENGCSLMLLDYKYPFDATVK